MPSGIYKRTEKHKKAISEANKGENNPFFGKKHSEETKKHWSEIRMGKQMGKDNPAWKNGSVNSYGYKLIGNKGKQVREHRLKMEEKINRKLTKEEVVHHINGIKDDNRIENLQLFNNQSEHRNFELRGILN